MIRRAAVWVWDFVVGDDWRTAACVVAILGATALVAATGAASWWLGPPAALAVLYWSVRRVARVSEPYCEQQQDEAAVEDRPALLDEWPRQEEDAEDGEGVPPGAPVRDHGTGVGGDLLAATAPSSHEPGPLATTAASTT